MTQLFKIVSSINTITIAKPDGQTPGLYQHILMAEDKEVARITTKDLQVVFDDQPAGYYLLIVQRVDTDWRIIGNPHIKGITIDESLENSYEAIASVDVTAYKQQTP